MNTVRITTREMPEIVRLFFQLRLRHPKVAVPIFLGPSGIGKTEIVEQVAREVGQFYYFSAEFKQQSEIPGIPVPDYEVRRTRYFPFAELPERGPGIMLVDDVSLAQPGVMNAVAKLVYEGAFGEWTCPQDVLVVLAANRRQDVRGARPLPDHLLERGAVFEVVPSAQAVADYFERRGYHPALVAYLRAFPEEVFYDGERDENTVYPCPRQWESVARLIQTVGGLEGDVARVAVKGLLGMGTGTRFVSYWDLTVKPVINPWAVLAGEDVDVGALAQSQPPAVIAAFYALSAAAQEVLEQNRLAPTQLFRRLTHFLAQLERALNRGNLFATAVVTVFRPKAVAQAFAEYVRANAVSGAPDPVLVRMLEAHRELFNIAEGIR